LGILGYGIFAILYLGIWDMCSLNYWDMGYCIGILGIFRDIFGFWPKINFNDDIYKMLNFLIDNLFVQCGGHVLQHLICIKIGTVRPTHRLVSSLLQCWLNRSCQDERTASGQVVYGIFAILFLGIWDMCPLNYWDMEYCIVILGIFRDIFGFWK
jgi:hypothetical protein